MESRDSVRASSSTKPQSWDIVIEKQSELINVLKSRRGDIQGICEISGVVGMSLAVIDHGETIFEHHFGHSDAANKKPVDSDTIFHIGSLTKSFTGVCIHQLRARGKLELDDPIQELLPDASSRDPIVAKIGSVADLLGHRTGLQQAETLYSQLGSHFGHITGIFRNLLSQSTLRSQFLYNSICYATLGEVITEKSGQKYHYYLKEHILDPLNMTRTIVEKTGDAPSNLSQVYGALDNGEPCHALFPRISANTVGGAAGGLLSTTRDLAKYCKALMRSWRRQTYARGDFPGEPETEGAKAVFGDVSSLFAPLQIMETPCFREKSYASRWVRTQLPNTVGDLGINPGLVDEWPLLADGTGPRLALWHQGGVIGGNSFMMLLPETESAVLVLTNTMALNDAADWVGRLLVETVLDTPAPNDYVRLASMSAERALKRLVQIAATIEEGIVAGGPPRPLKDYVGRYSGLGGALRIIVKEGETGLHMFFQTTNSQKYRLRHHHDHTFTWYTSWNEQIESGQFINDEAEVYLVHFQFEEAEEAVALEWVHDSAVPQGEVFKKEHGHDVSLNVVR